jgi:hypothetical protein
MTFAILFPFIVAKTVVMRFFSFQATLGSSLPVDRAARRELLAAISSVTDLGIYGVEVSTLT